MQPGILLSKYRFFILIFTISFIFSSIKLFAQESSEKERTCATDIMNKLLLKENPLIRFKNEQIERSIYYKSDKTNPEFKLKSQVQHTIPVVVHIIHNNGTENIPDALVIQGIQDLNDAFKNQGAYQYIDGVDAGIEFCLASQDENGNFTTGITRTVSTLTNMTMETDDTVLKNLNRWDPTKYLNIWLVNEISSISMGAGVAGYAFFPSSHGNPEDGIVNEAHWFGSSVHNSKIHIHEAGHYLGLYHTFEGGCQNNNCLLQGDHICDTPPDASTAPVIGNGTINTCTTDDDDLSVNNPFRPLANGGLGDQNDLYIDYMDYGFQVSQTTFTEGQRERMNIALTGSRASLLTSLGCQSICNNPISVSFTSSATNVLVGTTINFTTISTGSNAYNWDINGINFSSSVNPSYQFNSQGTFIVSLTASNGDISCTKKFSDTITVSCAAQASFTFSSTNINAGDLITFTNTSTATTSSEWFIDGISQGNSTNFTHTFNSTGGFIVYLVSGNGICYDTSEFTFIRVGICGNKQANQWVFGSHSAIDFNSGSPVFYLGTAMNQFEGCSSIADDNGNLLFYTDGISVWNRSDFKMPNGDGLNGDMSSSQSALIVKQPSNDSLYYLFTTDNSEDSLVKGFEYSIINMNLQGGSGDVILKNQLLVAPTAEKQIAVKHCNGRDVWVICHQWNSDAFYSYLLTPNGINLTPVISHSGSIHIHSGFADYAESSRGCMKASANGKRIALAKFADLGSIELFDFNNSTGTISNPLQIPNIKWSYGIEFSPNSSILYGSGYDKIRQYNLLAGSPSAIINSERTITITSGNANALQLAPDGKIYVAKFGSNFLGAINNPNAIGINYYDSAVSLASNMPMVGLPNLITSYYYNQKAVISGPSITCMQADVVYSIDSSGCAIDSSIWTLRGNGTVVSSTNNSITLNFPSAGTDSLFVEKLSECGLTMDTLVINHSYQALTLNLGNDTTLCSSNAITLNAGNGYASYLWQGSFTSQFLTVTAPGIYWVTVKSVSGCTATDSIRIKAILPPAVVNLGPDKTICSGAIKILDAGAGFTNYRWQDNSTAQRFTAFTPGKYFVNASNDCFSGSDTINVFLLPDTLLQLGNDTTICENESVSINGGNSFVSYQWQNGNSNNSFNTFLPGTYYVSATSLDGCEYHDTITVSVTVCSGFNENENKKENEINIFPNPGSGKYLISGLNFKVEELEILNALSQKIYSLTELNSSQQEIDISEQADGIYFIRIINSDKIVMKKVILQH